MFSRCVAPVMDFFTLDSMGWAARARGSSCIYVMIILCNILRSYFYFQYFIGFYFTCDIYKVFSNLTIFAQYDEAPVMKFFALKGMVYVTIY